MARRHGIALCLLACLAATCPGTAARPQREGDGARWVGTWMAAPQLTEPGNMPPEPGFADATLRQVVRVTIGGERMRVRFSNEFGTAPLEIVSAHAAAAVGGGSPAIRPDTDTALSFGGKPSVTVAPGAVAVSDPVRFPLPALSDLAVTVHVKLPSKDVTGHPGSRCTSFLQAGDVVTAEDLPAAARVDHWYFLSGVEVVAGSDNAAAVVVLGDSITDGRNSTTNGNGRWPDYLARRLQADARTRDIAVLNAGIGGNRVLNDGLGPSALARLERDVLTRPGVRWLIVLEGINDLGTRTATADPLIAGLQQIAERARARGIKVYGATILPCGGSFYFTPELEAARRKVNDWIRTGGAFDAVIDFDAATRDPKDPTRLSAAADSDDHLHPTEKGYKLMADSVDLKLFAR